MATLHKLTRREIAAAWPAAVLLAQAPAPPPAQNAGEELNSARDALRQNAALLDKFPLPISTEPAVHFRA